LAAALLDRHPGEQEPGCLDSCRGDPRKIGVVERGALVDAEELRSRSLGRGSGEQRQGQRSEDDPGNLSESSDHRSQGVTVKLRLSGVESTFAARSIARTSKL
jgi:hypothetical protein